MNDYKQRFLQPLEEADSYLAWFIGVEEYMTDEDWDERGDTMFPIDGDEKGLRDAYGLLLGARVRSWWLSECATIDTHQLSGAIERIRFFLDGTHDTTDLLEDARDNFLKPVMARHGVA